MSDNHQTSDAKKKVWEWDGKEPNLLKNTESGRYWGRFKVAGKNKWYNLETDKRSIAIIKLSTFRKEVLELRENKVSIAMGRATMGMLADEEEKSIQSNAAIRQNTKENYIGAIATIRATWPGFDVTSPRKVDAEAIKVWRDRISTEGTGAKPCGRGNSSAHLNKCMDMLRNILRRAIRNGQISKNPLTEERLKLPVTSKKVKLPDSEDMDRLFSLMEERSFKSSRGGESADFCQFLAFTGARLSEVTGIDEEDGKRISEPANWSDVDLVRGTIHIRGTKTPSADRFIPIFEDARVLLKRLHAQRMADPDDAQNPNALLFRCQSASKALGNACKELGLPILTHHDLRDHFATACIEAGTPIPTVAAWLGHSDGGALLLKVYNHHRGSHSMRAARNVSLRGKAPTSGASRLPEVLVTLLNEEISTNGQNSAGAAKIIAAAKAAGVDLVLLGTAGQNEALSSSPVNVATPTTTP